MPRKKGKKKVKLPGIHPKITAQLKVVENAIQNLEMAQDGNFDDVEIQNDLTLEELQMALGPIESYLGNTQVEKVTSLITSNAQWNVNLQEKELGRLKELY